VIRVRFLSPALEEVSEVSLQYAVDNPAVAHQFFDQLDRVETLLAKNPRIGRPTERGARKFRLRKFPYDVVYRITHDEVTVLAVAHHRRDPGYWMDR
jgi:plasmid stabilization system protein ParE